MFRRGLVSLLLLLPALVMANLRAPMHSWEAPSAGLRGAVTKGLVVLREELKIACDHDQCHIEASYHIKANKAERVNLEFLLPTNVPVTAKVNNVLMVTELALDSKAQWGPVAENAEYYGYDRQVWPVYKASFDALLTTGVNHIDLYYTQSLSILEARYGYFTNSRFLETFTYLLSPLKEWTLSNEFELDISVLTLAKRPDRDPWSLFKKRAVNCSLANAKLSWQAGWVIYRAKLTKQFPDQLVCRLGDQDLL